MPWRYVVPFLAFASLLSCGRQFEPIPPKFVTSAEVRFKGINQEEVTTPVLYSVPGDYDSQKSHPLVVALHGTGSNSLAFHDLWKSVTDTLGFVLLTPQGESKTSGGIGWQWGDNAESAVLIAIEAVRKSVNIDPRRIYIAGFSSGGSLAYSLGLRYSNVFRGIAALGAPFDEKYLPKSKIIINDLRAYIAHGALEQGITEDSKNAADKLNDLGIKVKYVQYDGIGHTLPEPKELELMKILDYLESN